MQPPLPRALLTALLVGALVLPGCLDLVEGERERVLPPAAFLRAQPYPELIVEVDHTDDYTPSGEALMVLEETLRHVVDKERVTVLEPQRIPDVPPRHNTTQLFEYHYDTLDSRSNGTAAVIHVLYVNGQFDKSPNAIGVAWSVQPYALVVLYADRLNNFYTGDLEALLQVSNPSPETVERAVLVHEAGHVLGLVNNGIPMSHQREDPDHDAHSTFESSVMYYAANDKGVFLEQVQDNQHVPYRFDEHDLEDLRQVREGEVEPTAPEGYAGMERLGLPPWER